MENENDSSLGPIASSSCLASDSEVIIIPSRSTKYSANNEPVASTSTNALPFGATLFSASFFNNEKDECAFCGIKFDYICFVSVHCVLMHPKQFTSCLFCYMPFKDYESVKKHCYEVHPADITPFIRRHNLVIFINRFYPRSSFV